MGELTLGLDVGCASIGWALVDDEGQAIVAAGVRIFPEGVDRDQQGGEKSKSQSRRQARAMRRQQHRRSRRRRHLRSHLASVGLLPAESSEVARVLAMDPYTLRSRAVSEKLEPHELGRVFLHLAQRRGYLSNRKTDRAADPDTKTTLAEMKSLEQTLTDRQVTLGRYLAELRDRPELKGQLKNGRIRGIHTRRDMFEAEFDAIWEMQRQHYPQLLTDQLKYGHRGKQEYPRPPRRLGKRGNLLSEVGIHGLIFMQRSMYWKEKSIGRCELERREKRCSRALRIAQRFRIVHEVNNLRMISSTSGSRLLSDPEQQALIAYLSEGKERTFEQIRKKLKQPDGTRFNTEAGDRDKLLGHVTDAALGGKKGMGARWKELPEDSKDQAVDILCSNLTDDCTIQRLVAECGLTEEEAGRALSVNLPEGQMSFSKVAIGKLLPHMERGLMLMADDPSNSALHAAGYLRPDERAIAQRHFLPKPPEITNPIVRQAVIEVRKVVNAILREYVSRGGHRLARIHVELAREAKKSFQQRIELRIENARRRRAREQAAQWIEEFSPGTKPTRATTNRYLLWQEQREQCTYCGATIAPHELLNGDTDIDHILPRWRSLDDSMANKVVCHVACNRDKGDRTPREWLEQSEPERYARVLQLAEMLPFSKRERFQQKDIVLEDFVRRQLNDTAYASRTVAGYLRCLGATVTCPRGGMTAELRYRWGLNTKEDGTKNRENYRHHAVDAVVLALIDNQRLFALANARGKSVLTPWPTFRKDVESVVTTFIVSHRPQRSLRGELHEQTFYGATQKRQVEPVADAPSRPWANGWVEDSGVFVRRKPVIEIQNAKHLAKVRDAMIRKILEEHLRQHGVDPSNAKGGFDDVFKKYPPHMPSGVPIKRVRMVEESGTIRPVSQRRRYQYVKPGSNHHIVYRQPGNAQDGKAWSARVVTMLEAAQRAVNKNKNLPLVDAADNDEGRFLMSLSIGEMFEIDDSKGGRQVYVVRKMSQTDCRLYFKPHDDARKASELGETKGLYLSLRKMQQLNARKVVVDCLGRIRWAND